MCCAGNKDEVDTAETKLGNAHEEVYSFSVTKNKFCVAI